MDKEALFAPRIATDTVDIPGLGAVTVRGLSRTQLLNAGKYAEEGPLVVEQYMLAAGLLDPRLTVDEVARWQDAAPADELQPVLERINELSGIAKGSTKEIYKSV